MDERTLRDAAGVDVFYRRWPHPEPSGVVLIAHGASEHSGRYDRFAGALNAAGLAGYAPDHRGHGRTSAATGPGRMGPPGGGAVLVEDLEALRSIAVAEYPGVPIIAFGHSLGSMIMLAYGVAHSAELAGLVLCGFPAPLDDGGALVSMFQSAVDAGMGDDPVDALSSFNAPFEPARTPFDWLSRDPDEVDRYIADPYCGANMPLTYGYFIDVFGIVGAALDPSALASVACPVFLIAGDQDPAAAMGAHVTALDLALRAAGVDSHAKLYPGARHEILNDVNRDEVTADVIAFIDPLVRR
jgi:alpha-beta hydrolase superfamily lysophospholipase